MDGLNALIEFRATGAAVLTIGDFNVNYRRDSVIRTSSSPTAWSRWAPSPATSSWERPSGAPM